MDKLDIPADFRRFNDLLENLALFDDPATRDWYLAELIAIADRYLTNNQDLDAALHSARLRPESLELSHIRKLAKAWQADFLLDWDSDRESVRTYSAREAHGALKKCAVAIMVKTIKARDLRKGSTQNAPALLTALSADAGFRDLAKKFEEANKKSCPTDKQYSDWLREAFKQAGEK